LLWECGVVKEMFSTSAHNFLKHLHPMLHPHACDCWLPH